MQKLGATAEYIPHAGLDTSLTSTSLMRLISFWTRSKSYQHVDGRVLDSAVALKTNIKKQLYYVLDK